MGMVADAVWNWRHAGPGLDGKRADERLFLAIHAAATNAARRFKHLPNGEVDDLVQEKSIKLWTYLKDDACEPGAEDAYVRSAVHSGCKDLIKKRRPIELEDTTPRPQPVSATYGDGMLHGARRHIHALGGSAGRAMRWVYVEGRSPSDLVDALLREEIEQDIVDPLADLTKDRKRLSNRVDQWLSRGRKRVEHAYLREAANLFEDAPPRFHPLLQGRYVDKLSDNALAANLGLEPSQVKRQLERALLWLRARMRDDERSILDG